MVFILATIKGVLMDKLMDIVIYIFSSSFGVKIIGLVLFTLGGLLLWNSDDISQFARNYKKVPKEQGDQVNTIRSNNVELKTKSLESRNTKTVIESKVIHNDGILISESTIGAGTSISYYKNVQKSSYADKATEREYLDNLNQQIEKIIRDLNLIIYITKNYEESKQFEIYRDVDILKSVNDAIGNKISKKFPDRDDLMLLKDISTKMIWPGSPLYNWTIQMNLMREELVKFSTFVKDEDLYKKFEACDLKDVFSPENMHFFKDYVDISKKEVKFNRYLTILKNIDIIYREVNSYLVKDR